MKKKNLILKILVASLAIGTMSLNSAFAMSDNDEEDSLNKINEIKVNGENDIKKKKELIKKEINELLIAITKIKSIFYSRKDLQDEEVVWFCLNKEIYELKYEICKNRQKILSLLEEHKLYIKKNPYYPKDLLDTSTKKEIERIENSIKNLEKEICENEKLKEFFNSTKEKISWLNSDITEYNEKILKLKKSQENLEIKKNELKKKIDEDEKLKKIKEMISEELTTLESQFEIKGDSEIAKKDRRAIRILRNINEILDFKMLPYEYIEYQSEIETKELKKILKELDVLKIKKQILTLDIKQIRLKLEQGNEEEINSIEKGKKAAEKIIEELKNDIAKISKNIRKLRGEKWKIEKRDKGIYEKLYEDGKLKYDETYLNSLFEKFNMQINNKKIEEEIIKLEKELEKKIDYLNSKNDEEDSSLDEESNESDEENVPDRPALEKKQESSDEDEPD